MGDLDYQLYVYQPEEWLPHLEKDFLIDEPAEVCEYDNAIVEPLRIIPGTSVRYGNGLFEGGLCTEEGEFLAGLHRDYNRDDVNRSCTRSYPVYQNDVETRDETVIFGGLVMSHFGHMLCDGTTRLWYPALHPEDQTKVVFVVYPNQSFPYWELLELAGIPRERVEIITVPTKFSHVIVPGETVFSLGDARYKKEWRLLCERIRNSVEPSPYKKVYYTRTRFKGDNCIGEDYFEGFFQAQGFHVVAPETLPFKEQVALMAGADEVACTMGTIAHQIMFAKPGTRQIVLNRSSDPVSVAPMMNHASASSLRLVDIYCNLLPEGQGGGSVWFLTPTRCWGDFLADHPEFDASGVASYPFKDKLCEYVERWGRRYAEAPSDYRWIRRESVIDVIERINRYLLDTEIDRSLYVEPFDVANLRKDVYASQKAAGRLQEVAVAIDGAALTMRGATRLPLSRPDDLTFEFSLRSPDSEAALSVACEIEDADEGGSIFWCARIRLSDLLPLLERDGAVGRWHPELRIACEGRAVLPRIVVTEFAGRSVPGDASASAGTGILLSDMLPPQTALQLSKEGDSAVLALVPLSDALPSPAAEYRITGLHWDADTLRLAGSLRHPLVPAEGFSCYAVLGKQGEPEEMLFPLEVVSRPEEDLVFWQCAIDADGVLAACSGDESSRWIMQLRFSIAGSSVSIPFGRRRPGGTMAVFRRHTIVGGNALIPFEDAEKSLGFCLDTMADAVARPATPRIEEIGWEDGCLKMAGTLSHPLVPIDGFELNLCLVSKEGDARTLPADIAEPEGTTCAWRCTLSYDDLFGGLEPGTWHFAFEKSLADAFDMESFGRRRPEGSLARFSAHSVPASGGFWNPKKIGGSLGFRWSECKAGANAAIVSLSWTQGGVLQISGTAKHPLVTVEGFSCALYLESPDGLIDMGLERVGAADKTFEWRVSFPVRETLKGRKGEWRMVFGTTIAGRETREPFGRRRPKGTFAVFRDFEADPSISQFEDADRMLGFRVGKAKRSLFGR